MRFHKGTKVEVLSKAEVPSGSWQCAEIVCDYGHFCTVRYDGYQGTSGEEIVERVSRKAIRPCPPALGVTENWNPGDVVEVFQNFCWRMAIVLKVVWKKYILVRLLGSSLELKVNKFDIRVRQSWQNNKWIVIGKPSASSENGKHDDVLAPRHKLLSGIQVQKTTKTKLSLKKDYRPDHKQVDFQKTHLVSSITLKRGCHLQVETYAEAPQKFRAVQNQSRYHRERVANKPSLLKEVDDDVFPRKSLAKECIPALVNNRKTWNSEMDIERKKQIGAVGCSFAVNLESNDADSVTCSVGSCSISSSNSYKLCYPVSAGPLEDVDGLHSDAESFCPRRYEEEDGSHTTQEELVAEIHRLELHAYRCTIEALHASGPLSWEQEALMTNLRLSLHISNDEHLMELRNLISSENSMPTR